jgi:hypothetical protein
LPSHAKEAGTNTINNQQSTICNSSSILARCRGEMKLPWQSA